MFYSEICDRTKTPIHCKSSFNSNYNLRMKCFIIRMLNGSSKFCIFKFESLFSFQCNHSNTFWLMLFQLVGRHKLHVAFFAENFITVDEPVLVNEQFRIIQKQRSNKNIFLFHFPLLFLIPHLSLLSVSILCSSRSLQLSNFFAHRKWCLVSCVLKFCVSGVCHSYEILYRNDHIVLVFSFPPVFAHNHDFELKTLSGIWSDRVYI